MTAGGQVPPLPAAQIRAALESGHWEQASVLLDAHDREVRDALGGVDLSGVDATPWRELLRCQHELLDELRASRDEAAQALAQLGRDRRGARAYRESTA